MPPHGKQPLFESELRGRPGANWAALLLPPMAALSIGAAAIHFAVTAEHFTEFWLFGVFFAAIAWFQALWPLAYLRWPTRVTAGIALAANLGTVLLWAWTRLVGIPLGPSTGGAEVIGGADVSATGFETLLCGILLLLFVTAIRSRVLATPVSRSAWIGSGTWVVVVIGITTWVLALHGNDIMVMGH